MTNFRLHGSLNWLHWHANWLHPRADGASPHADKTRPHVDKASPHGDDASPAQRWAPSVGPYIFLLVLSFSPGVFLSKKGYKYNIMMSINTLFFLDKHSEIMNYHFR